MTAGAGDARLFRPHHLLALIPAVALVFSPYFANRIEPRILGMPFLLGWIVGWFIITSLVMGIILRIDRDVNREDARE
ncbi:MAG: DUF3311 domain-containing protein [Gemmatimonadota bacterium]|nr:DUF3311 domain-containing protein [Gemmatimonadota bacterium]